MKISLNTVNSFDCDRTCPLHETKTNGLFLCRFNQLFRLMGAVTTVHSHTTKVKVPYKDPRALEDAVKSLGWKWLGLGSHQLFDGAYTGHGFQPEGWAYPAVFADGEVHADTFNGQWGDDAKLDLLKAEYAIATAKLAAEQLGWQCERTEQGLTVYHPDSGTITLSNEGVCETTGFVGGSCHQAREALGLLVDGQVQNKPEFAQAQAVVQTGN